MAGSPERIAGIRIPPPGAEGQWRLDRDVLAITVVLWAAHFGILVSRAAATGLGSGLDFTLVRVGVALAGMASTFGLYALLRRRALSPLSRFLIAALASVPISFGLALANEIAWLAATDYYSMTYNLTWTTLSSNPGPFLNELVFSAATFIWVYICWCALYVGAVYAAEVRERDRRLAAAEAAAHEARLMALRFQLNPHFLFNTLNTLSGLVALDKKSAAERVLLDLSHLLRHSLSGEPRQLTTLAEEIRMQARYLDIEKVRFANRLDIKLAVPPECEQAMIPTFLLQPLVENAVKHGVAPSAETVTLTVRAERDRSELVIAVENSSPSSPPPEPPEGFGIGIANVRKRLAALYGDKAGIECGPRPEGGWRNLVRVPWKERSDHAGIAG